MAATHAFGKLAEFASPWNAWLAEKVPSPRAYFRFLQELRLCGDAYNQPDIAPQNQTALYEAFHQSGLVSAIKGIVRESKIDYNGINKPHGFDSVRSWPNGSNRQNPYLCLLAERKPTSYLGGLISLGGHELVQVYDEQQRLVLSSDGHYIRPGDWMGKLLVEYVRLQEYRNKPQYDSRTSRRAAADYRSSLDD